MVEPNVLNIPAYQRKRSISAMARKQRTQLKTKLSKTPTLKRRQLEKFTDIPIHEIQPSEEIFKNTVNSKSLRELKAEANVKRMKVCGTCEGYFKKINIAVIKVTSPFRKGSKLIFECTEGLFEQTINSIQVDGKDVLLAHSGAEVGIKVYVEPKVGGTIYKSL